MRTLPRLWAIVNHRTAGPRWQSLLDELLDACLDDACVVPRVDAQVAADVRASALEQVRRRLPHPRLVWHGTSAEARAAGATRVHWPERAIPNSPDLALPATASVHDEASAQKAVAAGAEALQFGPIFPPGTKQMPGVGVQALAQFAATSPLPVIAVGGLHPMSIRQLRGSGAAAVAVVTALSSSSNVADELRRLLDACADAGIG